MEPEPAASEPDIGFQKYAFVWRSDVKTAPAKWEPSTVQTTLPSRMQTIPPPNPKMLPPLCHRFWRGKSFWSVGFIVWSPSRNMTTVSLLIKYYLHYFQSTISICESISWDSHFCLVRKHVKINEFRTAPASHPFDANLWDSWLLELEPPNIEPELAASEPSTVRKQLWDKCQTYPNVVSFGWFCIQM